MSSDHCLFQLSQFAVCAENFVLFCVIHACFMIKGLVKTTVKFVLGIIWTSAVKTAWTGGLHFVMSEILASDLRVT